MKKKETVIQSQVTETSDTKIEKITKVFSDTIIKGNVNAEEIITDKLNINGEGTIKGEYLTNELDSVYNANTYHIYKNNCNHFTNAICLYLCNKPLADDIVNQYKTLQGTPFGDWVISRLDAINEQNKAMVPNIIEGKK